MTISRKIVFFFSETGNDFKLKLKFSAVNRNIFKKLCKFVKNITKKKERMYNFQIYKFIYFNVLLLLVVKKNNSNNNNNINKQHSCFRLYREFRKKKQLLLFESKSKGFKIKK